MFDIPKAQDRIEFLETEVKHLEQTLRHEQRRRREAERRLEKIYNEVKEYGL